MATIQNDDAETLTLSTEARSGTPDGDIWLEVTGDVITEIDVFTTSEGGANISPLTGASGGIRLEAVHQAIKRFQRTETALKGTDQVMFSLDLVTNNAFTILSTTDTTPEVLNPNCLVHLRGSGFQYVSARGGTVYEQWACFQQEGVLAVSNHQCTYRRSGDDPTNFTNLGVFDQVVQVYGDTNNGNFDYRSDTWIFECDIWGYTQGRQPQIGGLGPTRFKISMSTSIDAQLDGIALTHIDSNADGVQDTGVYANISDIIDHTVDAAPGDTVDLDVDGTDLPFRFEIPVTSGTISKIEGYAFARWFKQNSNGSASISNPKQLPLIAEWAGDQVTFENYGIDSANINAADKTSLLRFTDDNGTVTAYVDKAYASAPNIIDDSRIQIYNVTTDAELVNTTVSGGSGYLSSANPSGFNDGDTLRFTITYHSGGTYKDPIVTTRVWSASAGAAVSDSQEDNSTLNTWAIDGSAETGITGNIGSSRVEVIKAGGTYAKKSLISWFFDYLTTSAGVVWAEKVTIIDATNVIWDSSIPIYNNGSNLIAFTDELYLRDENASIGSTLFQGNTHGFTSTSGPAATLNVGGSALTSGESSHLLSIPTNPATSSNTDAIQTVVDAISTLLTTVDGKVDTVDGVVDSILVLLGTVDGKVDAVDTVVDAIKVVTDSLSVPSSGDIATAVDAQLLDNFAAIATAVSTVITDIAALNDITTSQVVAAIKADSEVARMINKHVKKSVLSAADGYERIYDTDGTTVLHHAKYYESENTDTVYKGEGAARREGYVDGDIP